MFGNACARIPSIGMFVAILFAGDLPAVLLDVFYLRTEMQNLDCILNTATFF